MAAVVVDHVLAVAAGGQADLRQPALQPALLVAQFVATAKPKPFIRPQDQATAMYDSTDSSWLATVQAPTDRVT